MITDFRREIYEPFLKATQELNKLNNEKKRIIGQYSDNDAQDILFGRGAKNEYQKTIIANNPNIQRDLRTLSALDEMTTRLQNQKKMLENDFLKIYGNVLGNVDNMKNTIKTQTDAMLQGSALAQARDQGFALGQATKRGDSEAMKQKIIGDMNRQGAEQRLQIQAQQADRMLQAEAQKANVLLGIAGQLQQQQQQDFMNKLTLQQMQAPRQVSRGGSGVSGIMYDQNGNPIDIKTLARENAKRIVQQESVNNNLNRLQEIIKRRQFNQGYGPVTQEELIRRINEANGYKSVLE